MKKKLIAFALSSASALTFADVNLYGRVAVGLEGDQFQNTTVPSGGSIQDMGSYFGIRGSDSIYGETAAIWQIEQYLDLTTGQAFSSSTGYGRISPNGALSNPGINNNGYVKNQVNTLASSESYLGLQGAWGRLRLGNVSNYMRSQMGNVDLYNYNNGVNGLTNYSRTSRILPTAMAYQSPIWGGFSFAGVFSFQSSGNVGASSINNSNNFGGGLNGVYSGAVYSLGAGYANGPFSVRLGTQIYQQVGNYSTGAGGMINGAYGQNGSYANAYQDRLEIAWDSGEGLIAGLGFQTTSGLGWNSWANSGGSCVGCGGTNNANYIANSGYNVAGLNSAQYQTQEAALTLGWHLGPWTPKVSYAYGNNMMYGGDIWSVATGSANQIANTGYNNAVAELDWNVTPKTIVFINYGQIWYGSTLQNISYCGTACATTMPINGSNQANDNQSSVAIGFSNTF